MNKNSQDEILLKIQNLIIEGNFSDATNLIKKNNALSKFQKYIYHIEMNYYQDKIIFGTNIGRETQRPKKGNGETLSKFYELKLWQYFTLDQFYEYNISHDEFSDIIFQDLYISCEEGHNSNPLVLYYLILIHKELQNNDIKKAEIQYFNLKQLIQVLSNEISPHLILLAKVFFVRVLEALNRIDDAYRLNIEIIESSTELNYLFCQGLAFLNQAELCKMKGEFASTSNYFGKTTAVWEKLENYTLFAKSKFLDLVFQNHASSKNTSIKKLEKSYWTLIDIEKKKKGPDRLTPFRMKSMYYIVNIFLREGKVLSAKAIFSNIEKNFIELMRKKEVLYSNDTGTLSTQNRQSHFSLIKSLEILEFSGDLRYYYYYLTKATLLRYSTRMVDKSKSQEIFLKLSKNEMIDFKSKLTAILNYIELLILELKVFGKTVVHEEILKEMGSLNREAQSKKLYPLLVQLKILEARIYSVRGEFENSLNILKNAYDLVDEHQISNFVELIDKEKSYLQTYYVEMKQKLDDSVQFDQKIERLQLDSYIKKALKFVSSLQ